jgi:hypothetical protein
MNKARLLMKALVLGASALPLVCALAWAAEKLVVIEREAAIRRDKRNYSPKLATAKEGEQVTLISREDPWIRVEFGGVEGWMNQSSVTNDAKVVLSGQAVASGVRATEQSAAGRGFNPTVEREYRKSNPKLDSAFHFLDKIEKETYPEEKVVKFLKDGRLADFAGGGGK